MQAIPPTIGHLKAMGLSALRVTCANLDCRHSGAVTFEQVNASDETLFPALAWQRRFICRECGLRSRCAMPDWTGYRASGMGARQEGQ